MIIVIEGIDQAGKSTQSRLLSNALRRKKINSKILSFPDYTTSIGKQIDQYLHGKINLIPQTIHCLLAANRWEKFLQIQKLNKKNSILIMNRYYQSNLVYGLTNGLPITWLENLDKGLPKPDLVIVLDLPTNESFVRKKTNRDKFEKNKEFEKKVTMNYRKLAKKYKWKIIDGSGTKSEVHSRIMQVILGKLNKTK